MRVDKSRFLELTVLLAAGCGAPKASTPETQVQLAAPASASPPVLVEAKIDASAPEPPPPVHKESASCNDQGSVTAACAKIGPACEGLRQECESLADGLRPKVAESFAECMAKARGGPACRSRGLGACFRSAIEGGCADDEAVTACRTLMDGCTAHGKKPRYTLDQCAKILSATPPGGEGDWRTVDEERLGYGPTAEACSLTYVLPYQPWGPSWR